MPLRDLIANKSNVKVGDKFKIKYTVINNGPNSAENVLFTYKVPNSLTYIKASVSIGNVKYDSKSKKVIWNIGKASVGNYTLNLILKSTAAARNNVTPLLTTTT